MEKKILLMKSFLQTCFFSLKLQKNLAILVSVFTVISLFDFLFYGKIEFIIGSGLNTLIFSIISVLIVLTVHQPSLNNRIFWWSVLGVILSAMNCTYHSDGWSNGMLFMSHVLMVGSLHTDNIKNIFKTIIQYFILQICMPFTSLSFLLLSKGWDSDTFKRIGRFLKLAFIPISLIVVFTLLYSNASQQFNDFIVQPILSFFQFGTPKVDTDRIFFWFIAMILFLPLLIPPMKNIILKKQNFSRLIKRNKIKDIFPQMSNGLNNELKIAVISMISLNAMVLIFNSLDLVHVWFHYTDRTAAELSIYVHNGTNMTILSTAIGSAVLLLFFRKNLNFHPKNDRLILLSKAWIIQNTILSISTVMRNFHYISEYGLTHKRMGVIIFIALTIVGLLFTYQKIEDRHSISHFFNRMTLSFFLILLAYSIIDHESAIIYHAAKFQKDKVDLYYLARLSNEHFFQIAKYQNDLEAKSDYSIELCDYDHYDHERYGISNWRNFQFLDYRNKQAVNRKLSLSLNGSPVNLYRFTNPCNTTKKVEIIEKKANDESSQEEKAFIEEPIVEEINSKTKSKNPIVETVLERGPR